MAVTYQPFRIDFLVDGAVAVSLNSAGLMAFEQYRDKREGDVDGMWEENFKTHADSKPRGPSALAMDVSFAACDNVYGIPEHSSSLSLPPTRCVGLGGEAECFRRHLSPPPPHRNANTPTRMQTLTPHSPGLYPCRGEGVESDPYRLYNLDVFEYEIDNPMALYGSIPYMIAHSAARTSGVFWLNAAEMWIDVEKTSSGSAVSWGWGSRRGLLHNALRSPTCAGQLAHRCSVCQGIAGGVMRKLKSLFARDVESKPAPQVGVLF